MSFWSDDDSASLLSRQSSNLINVVIITSHPVHLHRQQRMEMANCWILRRAAGVRGEKSFSFSLWHSFILFASHFLMFMNEKWFNFLYSFVVVVVAVLLFAQVTSRQTKIKYFMVLRAANLRWWFFIFFLSFCSLGFFLEFLQEWGNYRFNVGANSQLSVGILAQREYLQKKILKFPQKDVVVEAARATMREKFVNFPSYFYTHTSSVKTLQADLQRWRRRPHLKSARDWCAHSTYSEERWEIEIRKWKRFLPCSCAHLLQRGLVKECGN